MENTSLNNSVDNDLQIGNAYPTEEGLVEKHDLTLLEEKLVVKRSRQKVGEVIVRKQVETRTVHIPIRREKLIVEKSGTHPELITEVDLGATKVNGIGFDELKGTSDIYQAHSQFVSLQTARELLSKIADCDSHGDLKIRLELITDNSEDKQVYQQQLNS